MINILIMKLLKLVCMMHLIMQQ